jgi:hypothetical protein
MTRLMLSLLFSTVTLPAYAEQFSIECPWIAPQFLTFDTESNRAVYEGEAGTALKGRITRVTRDQIEFELLRVGTPKFELVWDQALGKLTWIGLANDPSRPTKVFECSKTRLRPILQIYDRMAPYD